MYTPSLYNHLTGKKASQTDLVKNIQPSSQDHIEGSQSRYSITVSPSRESIHFLKKFITQKTIQLMLPLIVIDQKKNRKTYSSIPQK